MNHSSTLFSAFPSGTSRPIITSQKTTAAVKYRPPLRSKQSSPRPRISSSYQSQILEEGKHNVASRKVSVSSSPSVYRPNKTFANLFSLTPAQQRAIIKTLSESGSHNALVNRPSTPLTSRPSSPARPSPTAVTHESGRPKTYTVTPMLSPLHCILTKDKSLGVPVVRARSKFFHVPALEKENGGIKFQNKSTALASTHKEVDMIDILDSCTSYDQVPIWLTFRLWQYDTNLVQLSRLIALPEEECCGNDVADMKKLFLFHGMKRCLDCFMLEDDTNMRNVGFVIDDDVIIGFNTILPYMTQYYADVKTFFYGKDAAHNSLIREWISYCVRNIRGRKISEGMWTEMENHLGSIEGQSFFGGTFRTLADTLMYLSLYPSLKKWTEGDFQKRYNLAKWFRLMQMDHLLRGTNSLLKILKESVHHPNYPFEGKETDKVNPEIL